MGMMSSINICRACFRKHMTHDFDKGIYVCEDCGAEFVQVLGKWHNVGTDEAWREMFLGRQIKTGRKVE